MEKQLTYKIYKLELETGKIIETCREFEDIMKAKSECDLLNINTATQQDMNNIKYFHFYSFYGDFQAFSSQEDLKCFAQNKLEAWMDDLNKLKALYMVATKSLLQGGLNKKEAV